MPARTGTEYLQGLRERDTEIWLGGERVRDVTTHPALCRCAHSIAHLYDVQHDPVDGTVTHIDFHAILLTEQIRIKVPLVLKGDPVGVKQESGVLEQFLREIEVECLPTAIPERVEHEVSAMAIGDTVHIRDLVIPAGVKITADPEGVVASVLTPKVEKPEEVTAEAAVTEPEVIREKKPEAEESSATEKPEKAEKKEDKKSS